MTRRVLPVLLVLFVLFLSGCAGGDRTMASVGDDSVSQEELLNYSSTFQRIELGATHPAPSLRAAAQAWIQDAAMVQALASTGVDFDADLRLEAEQLLQEAIGSGEILPVTPSTPGYDFMVRRAWLLREERTADPDVQDAAAVVLIDDVAVSSRLGRWNATLFQIGPLG